MLVKRHWFLRKVWRTVRRHEMLRPGERVVVAVSGGGDSVALLVALAKIAPHLGLELIVGHLNHQLRPSASEDQQFVVELGRQLGLPVDTESLAAEVLAAGNVEAKARSYRYRYLRKVARRFHCSKIATGHTLDDQAETVVLRMLRGTGFRGLRGILPIRGDGVIRPLIECRREEAREFLTELAIPWREDDTNTDPRFFRNRVRHSVLPVLSAEVPAAPRILARLAADTRDDFAAYAALLEEKLRSVETGDGALAIASLREMAPPIRRSLLRLWLARQMGQSAPPSLVAQLDAQLSGGRGIFVTLPGQAAAQVTAAQGRLVCGVPFGEKIAVTDQWGPISLLPDTSYDLPGGWQLRVEACSVRPDDVTQLGRDECVALVDADALQGTLLARPCKRGDAVVPFGMMGRRKLQDIFTDKKVPRSQRWGRPLVADAARVLWVPGVVRSNHALVTANSCRIWRLCAARSNG
ncbi:MAG: tRNA lysidine(34) synthetase TilS [Candidatus Binatia bacterium]|nr:tRNA lysidine(34) synthetase TilS [Candidatus Binatia bacterium]